MPGRKTRGDADEVRDDEAEDDGPEDVLDLRQSRWYWVRRTVSVFEQFAQQADGEEKRDAGKEGERGSPASADAVASEGPREWTSCRRRWASEWSGWTWAAASGAGADESRAGLA